MELEKQTKTKTYFVIIVFIIIILLSAYVVVDKIIKRNTEDIQSIDLNATTNNILTKSSLITELSLANNKIKKLYNYVNNKEIEYILFLNEKKELNWDIKSLIVSKNFIKTENKDLEILYIDTEEFEKKYSELFGNDITKLSVEEKTASICGAASYDFENDIYVVNQKCSIDTDMMTFYKNIIYKDDEILINKYYVFIDKYINNGIEEYSLYTSNKKDEDNLLVANIKLEEINHYISDMNIITFKYTKSKDGNYYFKGIA